MSVYKFYASTQRSSKPQHRSRLILHPHVLSSNTSPFLSSSLRASKCSTAVDTSASSIINIICSVSHRLQVCIARNDLIQDPGRPLYTMPITRFVRAETHFSPKVQIMPHHYSSSSSSEDLDVYRAVSFTTSSTPQHLHPQTSPTAHKSKVLLESCKDRLSKCFQRPCCPCSLCSSKTRLFKTSKMA